MNGAAGNQGIDSKTIEVDQNTSFPLTIPINGASQQEYWATATLTGTECSECARGFGGSSISSDPKCEQPDVQIMPGGILTYRGAYPRWEGVKKAGAAQSITINEVKRITNKPNTCGCRVSE